MRLQTVFQETVVLFKLLVFSVLVLMAWTIAYHGNGAAQKLTVDRPAPPACIRPVLALKNAYNSKEAPC